MSVRGNRRSAYKLSVPKRRIAIAEAAGDRVPPTSTSSWGPAGINVGATAVVDAVVHAAGAAASYSESSEVLADSRNVISSSCNDDCPSSSSNSIVRLDVKRSLRALDSRIAVLDSTAALLREAGAEGLRGRHRAKGEVDAN